MAETEPDALPDLLARLRAAHAADPMRPLAERRDDLARLRAAVLDRQDDIAAAIDADFGGRPAAEALVSDVLPVTQTIDYLHRNLRRFMRPRRRPIAPIYWPGRGRVTPMPKGVVGVLAPWNYPVNLALIPLATALAAGNRVLLKPSELTPATSRLIAEMLSAVFPADKVTTVLGDAELGAALTRLPLDHLFFTGSTGVGRKVMAAAAETLTPVTLELGGKSPVLVDAGFDIDTLARDLVFGKTFNAGQTCIAPDFLLLPRDRTQAFADAWSRELARAFPGGASDAAYTRIISPRHAARLEGLCADARDRGARVIAAPADPAHPTALPPALILDATPEMAVMREEIFGPLLPVLPCDSLDEALALLAARPHPLVLYLFSTSRETTARVRAESLSGTLVVNEMMSHFVQDALPFGGVGESGMGANHGPEGFDAMSHLRGEFEMPRISPIRWARPPRGPLASLARRLLLR